eukprot:scaffold76971_cov33-Attheya_sp.AAC.1
MRSKIRGGHGRLWVAWRHGRFGLFIGNQDVKGMRGCEWVELRCRGHWRLWQSLKHDQTVKEDMAGCGWLRDTVGSVDSLEIKMSNA